ncbi:MAG: DUF3291 domain-containing protein [Sandarakinorhabdus sp.]
MANWHLAQVNVGRMRGQRGDPQVAGLYARLDAINALADAAPGFVWRLQGEGKDATDLRPTADPLFLINMSVWADADALFDFVYRTAHAPVMGQRQAWFERLDSAHQALWWVPAGHHPSVDEALARLQLLDLDGPTQAAFGFKSRFPAPA